MTGLFTRKEKTIEELRIVKFGCGCTGYLGDNFNDSKFIPSCKKHIRQIYDLNRQRELTKAFDEHYEKPVMVIYDLMRECKACHYYILNDFRLLVNHFKSAKHRDVILGKSKAPSPTEFLKA